MPNEDIGRNDSLDQEIREAGMLSLEHNEKAILDAIDKLKNLLKRSNLSLTQKQNIQLNLAQSYQRIGQYHKAIDVLNSIEGEMRTKQDRIMGAIIKSVGAVSYRELGFYKESSELFEEVLNELDQLETDPKTRAFVCLEAGKSFRANGDNIRAKECWTQALEFFEHDKNELEHYARAKANLGFVLLDDPDETKQEEGVGIVEESSDIKRLIGDVEGLANNHCNLGLYYWRKKRYERAIAYTRKDLYLSRKVGNLRAVATTLGNLAAIYSDLKQLSPARKLLREAKDIGERLKDQRLIAIADHGLIRINEIGKEAGKRKEKIGPATDCGCGSGKEYQECCGRADFEPVDIPAQFGGISEDLEDIFKKIKDAGREPSRLDFILRKTDQAERRFAWSRMKMCNGWLEIRELPDMANHHLISATILADEAKSEPDSITKPLSCLILSVCALEAFINQVTFFLNEVQNFPESKLHVIPTEIMGDVQEFQRRTELTQKWDILGRALCGESWPPQASLWPDFKSLIYIRNELVHFKAAEYEQVVPPLRKPHDIIQHLPKTVEIRDIPHGWPARVLTPSFADWCVNVAESMIQYFRESYWRERVSRK
jgi:tetratricopeptide (TPR) repeat protein